MGDPFDFDAVYAADGEDQDEAVAADQIVATLTGEAKAEEVDEAYMADVDQRIEVAIYYRQLLKGPLFDVDTKETRIVEAEVRRFVRERAKELVGLAPGEAPPVSVSPFSPEEVTALKLLAARLLSSPTVLKEPPKRLDPKARRAPAPANHRPVARVIPDAARPQAPTAPTMITAPGGRRRGVKKVTVMHPETGDPIQITKVEKQNPSGRVPWPSKTQMEILTAQAAMTAGTAPAVNIDSPTPHTTTSSDVTAALAAIAMAKE